MYPYWKDSLIGYELLGSKLFFLKLLKALLHCILKSMICMPYRRQMSVWLFLLQDFYESYFSLRKCVKYFFYSWSSSSWKFGGPSSCFITRWFYSAIYLITSFWENLLDTCVNCLCPCYPLTCLQRFYVLVFWHCIWLLGSIFQFTFWNLICIDSAIQLISGVLYLQSYY